MRLCEEVITVVNQVRNGEDGFTDYRKTVIRGASWYGSLKATVDSSGLKAANQYIVRIPTDADFDGKAYLNPISYWNAEDVSKLFTFANGDLIVHGEVTETDNEITPKLIHDNYAEVLTILTVNDNRKLRKEPHWKVVGA